MERVSVEDAWLFPIVSVPLRTIRVVEERSPSLASRQLGSVVLYGLYLIIKYYGSEWINFALRWYFVASGVGSVWSVSAISDPWSRGLVFARVFSMFTGEFQTLRSLVRFVVGGKRWRSYEKYSLRYSKGRSKGSELSNPRRHLSLWSSGLTVDSFQNWDGFRGAHRRSICSRWQSSRHFSTPFLIRQSRHF